MGLPLVDKYSIYLFFSLSLISCSWALQISMSQLWPTDTVIFFLFLNNGYSLVSYAN